LAELDPRRGLHWWFACG